MEEAIDSRSLNPDTVVQTWLSLAELKNKRNPRRRSIAGVMRSPKMKLIQSLHRHPALIAA